jgi:hypothetical protein
MPIEDFCGDTIGFEVDGGKSTEQPVEPKAVEKAELRAASQLSVTANGHPT